jgi:branched-subunit amino acid transport protein
MDKSDAQTLLTLVLMALVTLLTRSFFFISSRPWSLPRWMQQGLQYAPIAALAAVVMPEIVMSQGQLITTLRDARLYAALAGALGYFRGHNVFDAILWGMGVYLPLHLLAGW